MKFSSKFISQTCAVVLISSAVSVVALAHGSRAAQAGEAIKVVIADVQKTITREDMRLFKSIQAEQTGHEAFAVTVGFTDQRQLQYQCTENEEVEPAVWVCSKTN